MRNIVRIVILLSVIMVGLSAFGAEKPIQSFKIPNSLKISWPWDLVSFDVPVSKLPSSFSESDYAMSIGSTVRPIQIEYLDKQGLTVANRSNATTARIWTIATVEGEINPEANPPRRFPAPESVTADLIRSSSKSTDQKSLRLRSDNQYYYIENGDVYTFRLRKNSNQSFNPPIEFSSLPHFIGGIKLATEQKWDCRARFYGDAKVSRVQTEIIAQGPIFIDARVRIYFAGSEEPEGTVKTVRLANSKQTFRFKPGTFDWEDAPKYEQYYECRIRFTWGDGWIDFNDRFRLPGAQNEFGMNLMYLSFGQPDENAKKTPGFQDSEYVNLDAATWVRWFEWDTFGGNVDQKWVPLQQRPKQVGRPFAVLRPIWNQGGGGAQDTFFARQPKEGDDIGNQKLPFFGIVAAYPSKWITMAGNMFSFVENGNRGEVRLPICQGGEFWYIQRAFGLYAAPQKYGTNINHIVRSHTDWTLNGQINKYILDWAGMNKQGDAPNCPNSYLYIERRYQDDFLNPTSRITRTTKNYATLPPNSCGASNAALAYIYTDCDSWMGWLNGWAPGNPNFHTDKYMGAIYMAAAMKEHPHAKEWLEFGARNFHADTDKVFFEPDGVGYECPGYSGYAMGLQLGIAESLFKQGLANFAAENPLFYKNALWHRKLLTPVDVRLGYRHEAPIGDTHRWTSGLSGDFFRLAALLAKANPKQAAELWATGEMLVRQGALNPEAAQPYKDFMKGINIPPVEKLDWSSQAFDGFGAVMRNRFGTKRESFVTVHAGRASGHYHNDDPAFHLYLNGIPTALDYNCSYTPRGDHAALHNTLTFGRNGTVHTTEGNRPVEAMEQMYGSSHAVSFQSTPQADVFVSQKTGSGLGMTPVNPNDCEFQKHYPFRDTAPITHKRTVTLVKSPDRGSLNDYLLVEDDVQTNEPVQLNLHLLGRDLVEVEKGLYKSVSQVNIDGKVSNIYVYVTSSQPSERVEFRNWFYHDSWMSTDDSWVLKPGQTQEQWSKQLAGQSLPPKDWKPRYLTRQELDAPDGPAANWSKRIAQTNGRALMPPPGWKSTWTYGEIQQWLRVYFAAPQDQKLTIKYCIYVVEENKPQPKFTTDEAGNIVVK